MNYLVSFKDRERGGRTFESWTEAWGCGRMTKIRRWLAFAQL